MRTMRRVQMQPIEADTLVEYSEKFNAAMTWVSQNGKQLEFKNDLTLLKGYVIYEVIDRVPETIEDIMQIHHCNIMCTMCKKYEPTDFNRGRCEHCRGVLKANDTPCAKFWNAWEQNDCWLKGGEEKYEKYINELRCKSLHAFEWSPAQRNRSKTGYDPE